MKGYQNRVLNGKFHNTKPGGTKNKMGVSPGGHVTDPWNTRVEEMSRRQRRMEVSSEGSQGAEGAIAP
jgi:hypothetical protein